MTCTSRKRKRCTWPSVVAGVDTVLVRYPREGHGRASPDIGSTRWSAPWQGSIDFE